MRCSTCRDPRSGSGHLPERSKGGTACTRDASSVPLRRVRCDRESQPVLVGLFTTSCVTRSPSITPAICCTRSVDHADTVRVSARAPESTSVLCQNCVTYPPKPWGNCDLRGHAEVDGCCGKSLIGNALAEIQCASARAEGINFQACSFNHVDISPLRINCLQPQFSGRFANCVTPPNVP
jgi:hypothetical protein